MDQVFAEKSYFTIETVDQTPARNVTDWNCDRFFCSALMMIIFVTLQVRSRWHCYIATLLHCYRTSNRASLLSKLWGKSKPEIQSGEFVIITMIKITMIKLTMIKITMITLTMKLTMIQ